MLCKIAGFINEHDIYFCTLVSVQVLVIGTVSEQDGTSIGKGDFLSAIVILSHGILCTDVQVCLEWFNVVCHQFWIGLTDNHYLDACVF
jgi:hypothetical protein